jgi:imidazolonepropionase-like amidohydrolase
MKRLIFSLIIVFMFGGAAIGQERTAVVCGGLLDGVTWTVQKGRVVLIDDERIVGIVDSVPSGYKRLDLSGYTVLPGLIDAHVHPLIRSDDYQVEHLKMSSAAKGLRGLRVVQDLMKAGWTTLRVAGDADVHYAHLEVRNAIDKGLFPGPTIVGAGHYISMTGGGGDIHFLGPEHEVVADGLIVDGPEEMRKAVRQEIKYGSDWIKLLVTGAFMSAKDNPQDVHFSAEELQMAVSEADRLGVPVMAHAHSAEGIKQAVKAGVRSIEHGTFIDDEGIQLMVARGTYLVPTIYIGEYFLEQKSDSESQKKMVELTRQTRDGYFLRVEKAIKAGVKIGAGTDNVGFPPQLAVRELAMLVKAGMTNAQALQAATRTNAELLQLSADIGTLEVGKKCDLIAVKGDPLKDLSVLESVRFVMKSGNVYHDGR